MTKDCLKSIHALTKYLQFNEKDFTAWNLLGLVLEEQGKVDKAKFAFKKCVDFLSAFESNELLKESGYVKNSNTISDSQQSLSELYKLANINLARCYFKSKNYEESYSIYLKCIQFAPKDIGVLHYFALVCFELKKFDESISRLKESLDICTNEDKPTLLNLLGIISFKINDPNGSMKYLQQWFDFN
jgi:tetratricopeptide (TPR) repeat protein